MKKVIFGLVALLIATLPTSAQNSFSDSNFRRTDAGLRLGCGIGYDMFYADLTYDIGLANICHDTFDTSHNGALMLNVGVNF